MAIFTYKAFDLDTRTVNGTVTADSPRDARDQLRDRGFSILSLSQHDRQSEQSGLPTGLGFGAYSKRRRNVWLVSFIRELSTLLGVGIPLLESLDTMAKQYSGSAKHCLLTLREAVASGTGLARAMQQQPNWFDPLTVEITTVGEHAGTLDESLEQLADFKEKAMALRNRIGTALLYPLIILLVGCGVSVFLMTYVVPQLLSTLTEAGKELPWATQVVKTVSDTLLAKGWIILLAVLSTTTVVAMMLRHDKGKLLWHRLQLRIPLFGSLIRKQVTSRVAMIIGALMKSGIVFEQTLKIAADVISNRVIREALLNAQQAVQKGQDIAVALSAHQVFSPTAIQVFAVGQQSGKLETMLDRLANDYDKQVDIATQRLAAIIEPVFILLLAVFVGMIAFATVLPILQAGKVL